MLAALAAARASRSAGLPAGSPPPLRAATWMSRAILVKILPRLASSAPFLRLMVDHLLWPDMAVVYHEPRPRGTAVSPARRPRASPRRARRRRRRSGAQP